MNRSELLAEIAKLEAQEEEADGSWAEYLHARLSGLRARLAEMRDED